MTDRDEGWPFHRAPGAERTGPAGTADRAPGPYVPRLDPWGRPLDGRYGDRLAEVRAASRWRPRRQGSPVVNALLFLATLLTTTMAGALHAGADPFSDPWSLPVGLSFSVPLMLILLCHEFGHYLAAMRHGVPTTLPYFIPGPPFLVGTFGAFIRMRGMPRSRRALFDVGAAGPWAGLAVSIPAVALGLALSEVQPLSHGFEGGLSLGNSILFTGLTRAVIGIDPADATILLHPIALAGWFGIFVTFLNLLPVGQLDGGHVVYALFGRRHRHIARFFLLVVLSMGFLGWDGWFVWALMLAFILKVDHPDTIDADTPLDPGRKLAAWATIGIFALTFMPIPLSVVPAEMPVRVEQPARPALPRAPRQQLPPSFGDPFGDEEQEPALDPGERPLLGV